MPIQIGQKPSPTFHQPLELLSDCHRRIENFLRLLSLVAEQAKGDALTVQQRDALETALRYFREAAPKHTADEEHSLFPRMRDAANPIVREALVKIASLEADHTHVARDHELIEQLGGRWLSQNWPSAREAARMLETIQRLEVIYEKHIAMEDTEIFPLAGQVLDELALGAVGREMAERRGQQFDSPWNALTPSKPKPSFIRSELIL
jgi:hemerythrin-like domain-containing protein